MNRLFSTNPNAGMELVIFGLMTVFTFFITLLAGMLLAIPLFGVELVEVQQMMGAGISDQNINLFRYMQIVNQIGIFIFPALLFGIFIKGNVVYYFHLDHNAALKSLAAVLILLFTILPLINFITSLNSAIDFPESLGGVENWMREKEEAARQLTGKFLEVTSPEGFLINFLMIAILPAIGEELFFRGALQQIFTRWFRNAHVAIIITSVLFSALHLQFFGFFPRFLLGLIFGYLFYWSRSLWLPVFAHFVNNGAAVIVAFLAARGQVDGNMDEFGNYNGNTWMIIIYTLFSAFLLYYIYRNEYSRAYKKA